jgi:hypothetical protein
MTEGGETWASWVADRWWLANAGNEKVVDEDWLVVDGKVYEAGGETGFVYGDDEEDIFGGEGYDEGVNDSEVLTWRWGSGLSDALRTLGAGNDDTGAEGEETWAGRVIDRWWLANAGDEKVVDEDWLVVDGKGYEAGGETGFVYGVDEEKIFGGEGYDEDVNDSEALAWRWGSGLSDALRTLGAGNDDPGAEGEETWAGWVIDRWWLANVGDEKAVDEYWLVIDGRGFEAGEEGWPGNGDADVACGGTNPVRWEGYNEGVDDSEMLTWRWGLGLSDIRCALGEDDGGDETEGEETGAGWVTGRWRIAKGRTIGTGIAVVEGVWPGGPPIDEVEERERTTAGGDGTVLGK